MIKMPLRCILIFTAMVFVMPIFALAHGFGQTLEKAVGDFVLDVDYDALELRAGDPVRFNFNIWNKDRTETPEFTDVWVRIAPQGPGMVFAGDLHNPEFGAAGFSYAFPTSGNYELSVRFQNNGESLHEEVSFSFVILEGTTQSVFGNWRNAVVGIGAGIGIGFALAFFFKRRASSF